MILSALYNKLAIAILLHLKTELETKLGPKIIYSHVFSNISCSSCKSTSTAAANPLRQLQQMQIHFYNCSKSTSTAAATANPLLQLQLQIQFYSCSCKSTSTAAANPLLQLQQIHFYSCSKSTSTAAANPLLQLQQIHFYSYSKSTSTTAANPLLQLQINLYNPFPQLRTDDAENTGAEELIFSQLIYWRVKMLLVFASLSIIAD